MFSDRYGNPLTTNSQAAVEAYQRGMDLFLAATHGAEEAFAEATTHDPNFALAHLALARNRQTTGQMAQSTEALTRARALGDTTTAPEQGQIAALGLVMEGRGAEALTAIRAHLKTSPRDAMAAQPCMGVFGLIGFSGQAGREDTMLDFTTDLAPHYGDDWWFLSARAFAQMEAGARAGADTNITRSMALNPRNANGAHYLSHLHYENGEAAAGLAYLEDWRQGYDRRSLLHCHISWHIALWAMAGGDVKTMWQVIDADIAPGAAWGPAINVLTDMAAILYRAEMAGHEVPPERWQAISAYASQCFPTPGIAFADVHAALAHAMAGNGAALTRIITDAKGPAADIVRSISSGFEAIAAGNWAEAHAHLAPVMNDHQRIGGSRAQRDLLEYAMANVQLRLGQTDTA
ncbi:Bll1294 protein, partial [hydrothermal vent metagenome]